MDAVLTWRESRVFRYVRDYEEAKGVGPSVREIGEAAGLASTASVKYVLSRLVEKGYLESRSEHAQRPRHLVVAPEYRRKVLVTRQDLITLLEQTQMIHGWEGPAGVLAHEAGLT